MSVKIKSDITFPLSSKNEKLLFKSKTDEKTSSITNQILEKSNTTLQTKPIPLPKDPITPLIPKPEYSKTYEQEKPFGPDLLSAIINAKKALKPINPSVLTCLTPKQEHSEIVDLEISVKNMSHLPSPQKNKPQSESETLPTAVFKKRVSFQTATKDKPSNEAASFTKIHTPAEINQELELAIAEFNAVLKNLETDSI